MTETPMLLLRNADVYAPEALGRRHLLLGGGKILWMGEDDPALPASLDVDTIDLDGARLVPGFIDGHVHVSGGGQAGRLRQDHAGAGGCHSLPFAVGEGEGWGGGLSPSGASPLPASPLRCAQRGGASA